MEIQTLPFIFKTTSKLSFENYWDHIKARFGIDRNGHRVSPGLYKLGQPNNTSPVFVTANYTLSFDALRSVLTDLDCYILVLDTKGVNVWCAAGKGTFGTDELVNRLDATQLSNAISHRKLFLPQLGAVGVNAAEVKKRTGFTVEFGPVRASDLPEYLKTRQATPEMRRVKFNLMDRLALVPVEITAFLLPLVIIPFLLYWIGGITLALSFFIAIIGGTVLFPILLPWLPTHNFSTKGLILGSLIMLPFIGYTLTVNPELALWQKIAYPLAYILTLAPITSFLALNFTGSTTFTSKSGVKKEIMAYIPVMAGMFGFGFILSIVLYFL